MSWFAYLALFILAALAGKFAVEGRGGFRIDGFERLVRKAVFWIGAGVGLVFGVSIFLKSCENGRQLSFPPKGLGVSKVLYATEDSLGFGPGGNETGVIVYELPESAAGEIEHKGITYLEELSQHRTRGDSHDWHGIYDHWMPTPILLVGSGYNANKTLSYDIDEYLNRYGFGISVNPQVRQEINYAISHVGNFAAYGRIGLVVVIPKSRKVVYAYRG
jgi:hypothetical protein